MDRFDETKVRRAFARAGVRMGPREGEIATAFLNSIDAPVFPAESDVLVLGEEVLGLTSFTPAQARTVYEVLVTGKVQDSVSEPPEPAKPERVRAMLRIEAYPDEVKALLNAWLADPDAAVSIEGVGTVRLTYVREL